MEPASDFTLENGLRVIVAPDRSAPVAALGLWVRAGVCDEPSDRRGMAHVLEHMMFRGSEHVGSETHAKRISRVGGRSNAFTSHDATVFHETFPSHALSEVFELEADRFRRLRLTDEHLAVERNVIIEELRLYENQPVMRAMRLLMQQVGRGHAYALDPLGRRQDLEALSLEDLRSFYCRLYRPDNVFVVLAGDVTCPQARDLADRHLGDWEAPLAEQASGEAVPPFRVAAGELAVRVPFQAAVMARIHQLSPSGEEDMEGVELLSALLAHGDASPVREALMQRRRLCVEAGAYSYVLVHGGVVAFYGAFLPPGRFAARRDIVRGLCDSVASAGPDPDLVARHLKRARKACAADGYSPEKRMRALGHSELAAGGYQRYETRLERLSSVTCERIQGLAQRLFAPANTLELSISPERLLWRMAPLGLLARFWPR